TGPSAAAGPHRPEGDTSHVDVADRFGNLVSATPSGGWLHSSPTIPDLGFCLTNRGQMFWLEPGLASSLAPGTRPRTTLSPTLVLRDGEPWLACGTPGGDQQDQWGLGFFLSVVLGGLDLQAAIDAPAYQSEHFPSSFHPRGANPNRLYLESRVPATTREDLDRRGHEVLEAGAWTLGRLSAVSREPDGTLRAAADGRRATGAAAGR
ncbi:MAG: gamma-glutamyltransferase, partial [Actinomycetota bacterium]